MTTLHTAARQALEALKDAADAIAGRLENPATAMHNALIAESALRAALEAQQEPVPHTTSERHFALREAHEHSSTEDYFAARPSFDGPDERKAFRAGFVRGFDAGEKVYAAPQPAIPQGWVLVPAPLLQKTADILDEATTYTGSEAWSPSMTDELLALRQDWLAAAKKEKA